MVTELQTEVSGVKDEMAEMNSKLEEQDVYTMGHKVLVKVTYPTGEESYLDVTLCGVLNKDKTGFKYPEIVTENYLAGYADSPAELNFAPFLYGEIPEGTPLEEIPQKVVINLPGYGLSSRTSIPRFVETMAYELSEVLKAVNSRTQNKLVAHSLGAFIALYFAQDPEYREMLIKPKSDDDYALVLIDPSVPAAYDSYKGGGIDINLNFYDNLQLLCSKIREENISNAEILSSTPKKMAEKYADMLPEFSLEKEGYTREEIWAELYVRDTVGYEYSMEQKSEYLEGKKNSIHNDTMRAELQNALRNIETLAPDWENYKLPSDIKTVMFVAAQNFRDEDGNLPEDLTDDEQGVQFWYDAHANMGGELILLPDAGHYIWTKYLDEIVNVMRK